MLSFSAVLFYDHLITLPEEIRHIWRQKLTFVNFLFLLNRYLLFVGYIVYLFFLFDAPLGNTVRLFDLIIVLHVC